MQNRRHGGDSVAWVPLFYILEISWCWTWTPSKSRTIYKNCTEPRTLKIYNICSCKSNDKFIQQLIGNHFAFSHRRSKKYAQLYIDVISNLADPINQKTLAALRFVPRMFTTYAKYGYDIESILQFAQFFFHFVFFTLTTPSLYLKIFIDH